MIDWGVPDVPEILQIKIKRENYLAKQALTDNIVLDVAVITYFIAGFASGLIIKF